MVLKSVCERREVEHSPVRVSYLSVMVNCNEFMRVVRIEEEMFVILSQTVLEYGTNKRMRGAGAWEWVSGII